MKTICTTNGDRLDQLLSVHYAPSLVSAMLPLVFAANPFLAGYPPELPAGIVIALPPAAKTVSQHVRLWS